MDRERSQELVAKAASSLPEEFHTRLENIDVARIDCLRVNWLGWG